MLAPAAEQGPVPCSAGGVAGPVPVPGQLDGGLYRHTVAPELDGPDLRLTHGCERVRRQLWEEYSFRGAGAVLVEAQTIGGSAAGRGVAGVAAAVPGARVAFAGVHGPATAHLHRGAVHRHLRSDGLG